MSKSQNLAKMLFWSLFDKLFVLNEYLDSDFYNHNFSAIWTSNNFHFCVKIDNNWSFDYSHIPMSLETLQLQNKCFWWQWELPQRCAWDWLCSLSRPRLTLLVSMIFTNTTLKSDFCNRTFVHTICLFQELASTCLLHLGSYSYLEFWQLFSSPEIIP